MAQDYRFNTKDEHFQPYTHLKETTKALLTTSSWEGGPSWSCSSGPDGGCGSPPESGGIFRRCPAQIRKQPSTSYFMHLLKQTVMVTQNASLQ